MNFNKYDDIINNNKYEMLFIYIYYSLKNHDDFDSLTDNQKETLIEFIHNTYLKDNVLDESYLNSKAHQDIINKIPVE